MSDNIIEFQKDMNKEQLSKLSNKLSTLNGNMNEIKFNSLDTNKNKLAKFVLGEVRAKDINELTDNIGNSFGTVIEEINKSKEMFAVVNETIKYLDEQYVPAIMASQESVRKVNTDIQKEQERLNFHQVKIDETISKSKTIIEALKINQAEISRIKHLTDLDKYVEVITQCQERIEEMQLEAQNQASRLSDLTDAIENEKKFVNSTLTEVKQQISDDILVSIDSLQKEMLTVSKELNGYKEDGNAARKKLSNEIAETRKNIEETAKDMETFKMNVKDDLQQQTQSRIELEEKLSCAKEEISALHEHTEKLTQSLKYNQMISITGVAFLMLLYILNLVGVL